MVFLVEDGEKEEAGGGVIKEESDAFSSLFENNGRFQAPKPKLGGVWAVGEGEVGWWWWGVDVWRVV